MATRSNSARKSSGPKKATRKKTTTARKKTTTTRKKTTTTRKKSTRKYSPAASENVHEELHEMKQGRLRSGRSGKKVTSRKQAIAIGLSEARRSGKKVPPQTSRKKR